MPGFYDTLNQNIAKYGGADEAYKLKLKENFRGLLGYNNYVSQKNAAVKKPLDLSLMKGNITPQGVQSLVRGAMDNKSTEVGTYQTMLNKVDTAASGLASDQLAREKAARTGAGNKEGFDNGVAFRPGNPLEQDILAYAQNPKNPDGSIKSIQQFEAEMQAKWNSQRLEEKGITPEYAYDPSAIKSAIESRVPKDFIGNEDKYSWMAQGYSSKQAESLQGGLMYEQMSPQEQLVFKTKNPLMAKALDEGTINKELLGDLGTTTDPKTGQTVPKYTYDELKEKYPNTPESDIKALVVPGERSAVKDDVNQWLSDKKDAVATMIDPNYKDDKGNLGYSAFMADPKYKQLVDKLNLTYGSVFTSREIEQFIYDSVYSSR